MSLYQCERCGCVENTATGWYWHRNSVRLTPPEFLGKALCCVCAPTHYASGEPNTKSGKWHNRFKRHYLPKGQYVTNPDGAGLIHIETGLPPAENDYSDKEYN